MIDIQSLTIENSDRKLVCELNLALNKGEFWAILGKNGTGKTTLLETLAGFSNYKQGSIKVDDKEINQIDILTRAQNISFLPQLLEASLNCTVAQSISYGRYPWHKNKNDQQAEQAIIDSAINSMELTGIRDNNIQQISGGELRKVEMATVLAQDSEIMMLDEPLNHLDLSFRFKLMQLLKKLSQNKIIIIVTHDIQYVQEYCTHVLMLLDDCQWIAGKSADIMNAKNMNKMLGTSLPNIFLN